MIADWMELVEHEEELTSVSLKREDRTVHLHKFFHGLLVRLRLAPLFSSGPIPSWGSINRTAGIVGFFLLA
jgi:hypothetical protein